MSVLLTDVSHPNCLLYKWPIFMKLLQVCSAIFSSCRNGEREGSNEFWFRPTFPSVGGNIYVWVLCACVGPLSSVIFIGVCVSLCMPMKVLFVRTAPLFSLSKSGTCKF